MAPTTIGAMLDLALEFERQAEARYADLRDRATCDGARLLVYYVARRRRHLPDALAQFTAEQIGQLRRAPLKCHDDGLDPRKCLGPGPLPSAITGADLLGVAI